MAKEEQDGIIKSETELSTFTQNFSDYMNDFDENVFAGSEIKISRFALMQPGSPEITDENPDYKIGMIVDNVTREIFTRRLKSPWLVGKVNESELFECHCTLIVPAFKLPSEFIKWKNLKTEGKGWHFKTLNRRDPNVREGVWPNSGGTWGTKEGQSGAPPVTENCNYMSIVIDPIEKKIISSGIICTFCKTSFSAGRDLTTFIRKGFKRNLPSFGMAYWDYTIKKEDDTGNKYCYHNIIPAERTMNLSPDAFDLSLTWHNQFSDKEDNRGKQLQNAYLSAASMEEEIDDQAHSKVDDDANAIPPGEEDIF